LEAILSNTCACGHDKKDHAFTLNTMQRYGNWKVCLCDGYTKLQANTAGTTLAAVVSHE